jgi:uncharacterized Zn finger protein
MQCNKCKSEKVQSRGIRNNRNRYYCSNCGSWFTEGIKIKEEKKAKILIFDIETAPMIVPVWDIGEQYVRADNIIQDWFILCWSAKWLYSTEVLSGRVLPGNALCQHDEDIVENLWKLLDEADIVVTQNGKKFDHKKLNTRFAYWNMPLPSSFEMVDTYQVAKSVFDFTSNSLDYMCKFFGMEHKSDAGGMKTWLACINGNKDALKLLSEYCNNDVVILENLYLRLRPYIKGHPNVNLYGGDGSCLSCGEKSTKTEGKLYKGKYVQYRCVACGALARSSTSSLTTEQRKTLTNSV